MVLQLARVPVAGGMEDLSVLDVLVEDGVIVVAIKSAGSLQLWRVTPYGDPKANGLEVFVTVSRICPAFLRGWERFALRSEYFDKESVAVKLAMMKDGRIQADVEDLRAANRPGAVRSDAQTRFVQLSGKWLFEIVKPDEVK